MTPISRPLRDVTRTGPSVVLPTVNPAMLVVVEPLPVPESFDDALVALYQEHAKELVEMLWVFVGDRGEAEDLCQEAFIRLHRAWGHINQSGNVGAYLRVTAFNLARSRLRRRLVAVRRQPRPEREAAPVDDRVVLREDQTEVVAAVRRLPRRQRECVVLRYWDELSDPEIAATLGLSVNSVKTHLRRAFAALERMLETP
jgi:RNA polymerase sigma-70 factor (sigma-E family)